MIHVSDMSWTRKINHPSEVLKKAKRLSVLFLNRSFKPALKPHFKQAQVDP